MTKVELTVPDKLSKIDPTLRDELLIGAIREVAATQLKEKEEVRVPQSSVAIMAAQMG